MSVNAALALLRPSQTQDQHSMHVQGGIPHGRKAQGKNTEK